MVDQHPGVRRDLDLAERLGLTLGQWDALPDSEREWWIARHDVEQEKCQHHGGPREECADPERPFYPQMTVCYAEMEADAANWRWDELYGDKFHNGSFQNWSDKRSDSHPYSHRAGVKIWVTPEDIGLGGDFLRIESDPPPESP